MNHYPSASMVPQAISQPILQSLPMFAAKPQAHPPPRRALIVTVATSRHHPLQRCHSPSPVFQSSSPIPQAKNPFQAHLHLTLNSRMLSRPSLDLERSVFLKTVIKIVALSTDILVSGYQSHRPQ